MVKPKAYHPPEAPPPPELPPESLLLLEEEPLLLLLEEEELLDEVASDLGGLFGNGSGSRCGGFFFRAKSFLKMNPTI